MIRAAGEFLRLLQALAMLGSDIWGSENEAELFKHPHPSSTTHPETESSYF